MKIIEEMRERQAFEQPKTTNSVPIILGVVIAFGIGALGVSGLVKTPTFLLAKSKIETMGVASTSDVAVDTSGRRLGRAESAALLRSCIPFSKLGIEQSYIMPTGELYRLLQAASHVTRFAAIAGIEETSGAGQQFTSLWGDVADCVYRQNGWMLCDSDNRALAVEAAIAFVRQLHTAEKDVTAQKTDNSKSGLKRKHDRSYTLQNATSIKERMLSALRQRAAEGRLVSSDFGIFAPGEILQAVREAKVTRDACATRS